jgi:hypothetical protein
MSGHDRSVAGAVDALRREAAAPTKADAELAALRADIWARQHAKDAARDAAACAREGLEPNPLMSLPLRRRMAAWAARINAQKADTMERSR